MKPHLIAIGAALFVTGCGKSAETSKAGGAQVPAQFKGVWARDCSSPFVAFADGAITVYPDTKPYALKDARIQGTDLLVSYINPQVTGTVTETYAIDGATLRLTTTAVDGKEAAKWNKFPMTRCGG